MQAKLRSVCWRDEAKRMRYPSPARDAMNSPTTMPMIARVAAIFIPEKIKGSAIGKRTESKICQFDAPTDRQRRSMSNGSDCRPVAVEIRIGKKQMKIEKVTRHGSPRPRHTMKREASGIHGSPAHDELPKDEACRRKEDWQQHSPKMVAEPRGQQSPSLRLALFPKLDRAVRELYLCHVVASAGTRRVVPARR